MTGLTAATPAHAAPRTPASPGRPVLLVRRIGYAVLGVQLVGFLVWSTILYQRFALTFDFAISHQAWFQLAHGNLDPAGLESFPFWQDHSAFMMWPLALLYWVWPHSVTLLWVQDFCVVGAEAVALTWLCTLAERRMGGSKDAARLAAVGLILLAANPWIWWAISFDFHMETVALLIAALLARDLANGRRRAWVWVLPLLACGDVADTYLAGIGMGGLLAGRRSRIPGAVMACLGIAAALVISVIHGNRGSGGGLQAYAYLTAVGSASGSISLAALAKGIITHPLEVLRTLWLKRVDILANLAPAGLVGVGDLLLLPLVLVVLLANSLFDGLKFAEPIFQYLPVYVLLPVGTVVVLARLTRRHRTAGLLLACLVITQALGWTAVWGSHTSSQWLRVSAPAAVTLGRLEARIPHSAEVIVSEGVMGRFADRNDIEPLAVPEAMPVASDTWFVIVPSQGLEIQTTASAMALIGELATHLHATLIVHAHGVWAFHWRPPPDVRTIAIPSGSGPISAWTAPVATGTVGEPVMAGPIRVWRVTSTGRSGYVADELAWQKSPGLYQAYVTLFATGPVNVEVWNDNGNTLLARLHIPATSGIDTVTLQVNATVAYRPVLYSGWGPFQANFVAPPPGQRLEVRVWAAGAGTVNVYRAELVHESSSFSGVKPGS